MKRLKKNRDSETCGTTTKSQSFMSLEPQRRGERVDTEKNT